MHDRENLSWPIYPYISVIHVKNDIIDELSKLHSKNINSCTVGLVCMELEWVQKGGYC